MANPKNILMFGTSWGPLLQDTITTLMQSKTLVKKCIGQYVLLMGKRAIQIYQYTGADLPIATTYDQLEAYQTNSTPFDPPEESTNVQQHQQISKVLLEPPGEVMVLQQQAIVHN